ncbi:MAG: hypothetical protein OEV64_00580 [Desulfobulbaceae bacterium]|nr:hypothetical protein [Desulfobulbaceae bacterium]
MTNRKCIFIVGMHRSGTSSLTGALQIMGCPLGSKLLGPFSDNPKGFFENERVWGVNQKFLEQCGSSWDDPFLSSTPCPPTPNLLEEYRQEIVQIVQEEFRNKTLFAVKDPRFCMLFPIWKDIFQQLNISTPCIIAVRHPFESAASLKKRNNFSMERGILMWMNHMLQAEIVTRDCPRVFTSFDSLLCDPITELRRISQELHITFPKSTEKCVEELTTFFDRDLRHHTKYDEQKNNFLISQIIDYHSLLCEAAGAASFPVHLQDQTNRLHSQLIEILSFFYNADISLLFQSNKNETKQLAMLRREYEEQGKRLQQETSARSNLENLVGHMQKTKTWRLAEFLRNFISRRTKQR